MNDDAKEIQYKLRRSLFWDNKGLLFGSFFFKTSFDLVTVCSPYITSVLMNAPSQAQRMTLYAVASLLPC